MPESPDPTRFRESSRGCVSQYPERRAPPSPDPTHLGRLDEHGKAAISSAAFKDEELSINLESTMAPDGRPPEDAIRSYPGYVLAAITAAHARSLQQAVARDPLPDEPAHGVVYGQKKRGAVGGSSPRWCGMGRHAASIFRPNLSVPLRRWPGLVTSRHLALVELL